MSTDTVFNFNDAMARVDHDPEIFHMMAELFVEQGPKDLAATQAALSAHDAAAVARAAHRLKGAILQFCAPSVLEAACELERLGKSGNLETAVTVCASLEAELQRLMTALREHLERGLSS